MSLFKPFRGNRSALDVLEKHDGYAYFCMDDGTFHIDYTDDNGELQRKQINAKDAETLLGATLVHELTNSELEIPSNAAVTKELNDIYQIIDSSVDDLDARISDLSEDMANYVDTAKSELVESMTAMDAKIDEKAVQADWNQNDESKPDFIKNRICYDESVEGTVVLTFDGDTTGKEVAVMSSNEHLVKMSDDTPTVDDLLGHTVSVFIDGSQHSISIAADAIGSPNGDISAIVVGELVLIAYTSGLINGASFTPGIWFVTFGDTYVSMLSYRSIVESTKKIDGKYLYQADWNQNDSEAPDYIKNRICYTEGVDGPVTIAYDGDMNEKEFVNVGTNVYWVKVSNIIPVMSDCIGATVIDSTGVSIVTTGDYVGDVALENNPGYYVTDNIRVIQNAYSVDGATFTPGIWFAHTSDMYIATMTYNSRATIVKIDEKYLPDITWDMITDAPFGPDKIEIFNKECNDFINTGKFYAHVIQPSPISLTEGKIYDVVFDGVTYENLATRTEVADNTNGEVVIGNLYIANNTLEDTKEPFIITSNPATMNIATNSDYLSHTVQIFEHGIKKIGMEYLDIATDDEIIAMLMDEDMFPVVTDGDGSTLTDENGNILLW